VTVPAVARELPPGLFLAESASALFAEEPAEGDGSPPSEIQLIPSGKTIKARDGRTFKNSNPKAIVAAFEKDRMPLPIDTDHATELFGGPAVGWIESLSVKRGGSIWGDVTWNESGHELIQSRAFRFISPAMFHDEAGEVLSISSAALVNRPALRLKALSSHQGTTGDDTMDKALLAALGLAETATAEEATAKAKALALALKAAEDKTPSLEQWTPRADYTAALARAEKAEGEIKALAAAEQEKAIAAAVDQASKDGKITPAQRDQAIEMCRAAGLEAFSKFVGAATVVGEPSGLDQRSPTTPGTGAHGLTDEQLAIAHSVGVKPELYARLVKGEIDSAQLAEEIRRESN
jgi:phage I-like protein